MSTTQIIVVAVVILVLIAIAVALYVRRLRSSHLRSRFGPEYAHAVEESGPVKAEHDLQQRERRVRRYRLKLLPAEERQRFESEWSRVQALFVDNPSDATAKADDLLGQVMTARGYPAGPFDQRLEDLSVEHGNAVQGYRAAHEVAVQRSRGEAGTEDMRKAMLDYRRLFDELVGDPEPDSLRAAS